MSKRVLVVEDQEDNMRIMNDMLSSAGYEVIKAVTGDEGVAMAESHKPDLILMDVVLPEMNGLEAARRIRQKPESCSIPILAVTARVLPQAREQCLQSGCTDYISKPFTPKELASRIEKLLQ